MLAALCSHCRQRLHTVQICDAPLASPCAAVLLQHVKRAIGRKATAQQLAAELLKLVAAQKTLRFVTKELEVASSSADAEAAAAALHSYSTNSSSSSSFVPSEDMFYKVYWDKLAGVDRNAKLLSRIAFTLEGAHMNNGTRDVLCLAAKVSRGTLFKALVLRHSSCSCSLWH